MGDNLLNFQWNYADGDPTQNVDMRDTWILADFLQGHCIKNAILDHFFNHIQNPDNVTFNKGKLFVLNKELIDYTFINKLWTTQFGRAILYCIRKEIDAQRFNIDAETIDSELLPTFLETIFSGAEQDFNYLPWYFDLARLILLEMIRPFTGDVDFNLESTGHFCGVLHHHPNELRCTEDNDEDEDDDGDMPDYDSEEEDYEV